jgi:hypothetical protein
MENDDYEYEYEYELKDHSANANDLYGDESVSPVKVSNIKDVDDNWDDAKMGWQPSTNYYTSNQMGNVLARLSTFNQMVFMSWSSLFVFQTDGSGGSIFRFQHTTDTRSKSNDFDIAMRMSSHKDGLKENMGFLKEEVQCDLVMLDTLKVGGIKMFSGTSTGTEDGCIQVFLAKVGPKYSGWLSLCDRLFIPMTNKFIVNENASKPRLEWKQAFDVKKILTIEEARKYQRSNP